MQTLLVGKPGAGKSLKAVKDFVIKTGAGIKEKPSRGKLKGKSGKAPRHVLTNIPLNLEAIEEDFPGASDFIHYVDEVEGNALPFSDVNLLREWCDEFRNEGGEGPLFVIDEAHISFAKGQTTKEALNFFTLHRKYGCDILLVTQQVTQIDRNVAGLSEVYIILNRNRTIGLSSNSYQEIIRDGYPRGAVVSTKNNLKHDRKYFQYYGSHFATGISEAEDKIKPIWMNWQILLPALIFPIALGYGIMQGLPAFSKMMGWQPRVETPAAIPEEEVAAPPTTLPGRIDVPAAAPPPPTSVNRTGVVGEELTGGFATSADNLTSGLSELGVLTIGGPGVAASSKPTWSIVSWIGYQTATGEDVCKTRFAINGEPVMTFDAKLTMGWEKIEQEYDRKTGECITIITPKMPKFDKTLPEDLWPEQPDPIIISNRE